MPHADRQASTAARIPPGTVVQEKAPVDGVPEPGGLPAASSAAQDQREPRYVYAASREEAQRLLDNSYLKKYRAVPVRRWRRWLRV